MSVQGWPAYRGWWVAAVLFAIVAWPGAAQAQSQPQVQAPDAGHAPEKWPHIFPLLGKGAATRGIKLPLPFGVGMNYAFADQAIDISRVAVGVNGSEPVDVTDILTFDSVQSKVHVMNVRADMWLFPFLNVYGMGNYVIESNTAVSISEPFAFQAGAVQPGAGGGFGGTFAAGVWGFFATVDLNWTWNKMQNLQDPVGTYLLTPRVGRNLGQVLGVELIVWVGAMRQNIASATSGDIRLSDTIDGGGDGMDGFKDKVQDWYDDLPPARQAIVRGLVAGIENAEDPVIHYELDKAVKYPWNMLVGAEIGLTPAWRLRTEVGFIERTQVIVGFNYRFGDNGRAVEP